MLKGFSQLGVTVLLYAVLAIAFHYHGDLVDHPDCYVCTLAKSLSAMKRPATLLLSGHVCTTFHDISVNDVVPVSHLLPLPKIAKTSTVTNRTNVYALLLNNPVASRASPSATHA